MIIMFTGHRNKQCLENDLKAIKIMYPDATWIHGGARGFDSQVDRFANENSIETIVVKPEYGRFGKAAPIIRNKGMIAKSDIIFALYDGRKSGGTYFSINYAKSINKPVQFLSLAE